MALREVLRSVVGDENAVDEEGGAGLLGECDGEGDVVPLGAVQQLRVAVAGGGNCAVRAESGMARVAPTF